LRYVIAASAGDGCSLLSGEPVAGDAFGVDGMNLVAKEFVASQILKIGCLDLVALAGAARELDTALSSTR